MTATAFTKDGLEFYAIEDGDIRLCVCPRMGGEMSSLQFKKLLPGHELLFRGNDYSATDLPFKGRAPLMWPTVTRNYVAEVEPTVSADNLPGRCGYRHAGRIYYVEGRSGFARDFPWQLLRHSAAEGIRVGLTDSEATLQIYPFRFSLTADYLIERDRVRVTWRVGNRSPGRMFFSIGNHIGINIPLRGGADIADLLLQSTGLKRRSIDEHLMFTDRFADLPLSTGIRLGDDPDIFTTITCGGYGYEGSFMQLRDGDLVYRVSQRVCRDESSGVELPDPAEIYFTTYGKRELGFICLEPWIGGINSFNTGKGLIHFEPSGVFVWEMTVQLSREQ